MFACSGNQRADAVRRRTGRFLPAAVKPTCSFALRRRGHDVQQAVTSSGPASGYRRIRFDGGSLGETFFTGGAVIPPGVHQREVNVGGGGASEIVNIVVTISARTHAASGRRTGSRWWAGHDSSPDRVRWGREAGEGCGLARNQLGGKVVSQEGSNSRSVFGAVIDSGRTLAASLAHQVVPGITVLRPPRKSVLSPVLWQHTCSNAPVSVKSDANGPVVAGDVVRVGSQIARRRRLHGGQRTTSSEPRWPRLRSKDSVPCPTARVPAQSPAMAGRRHSARDRVATWRGKWASYGLTRARPSVSIRWRHGRRGVSRDQGPHVHLRQLSRGACCGAA